MPIARPRFALWSALLVLAVVVVGGITLSEVTYAFSPPPTPAPRPTPTPTPPPTPTAGPSFCPGAISWDEAGQHVGTQKTVKGGVSSMSYVGRITGRTVLPLARNPLGNPYGDVRVVIPPGVSPHSGLLYRDRFICVTGLIEKHQDRLEIEVTVPSQLVIYSSPHYPPVTPPQGLPTSSSGEIIHVVKSGDTLSAIAQQYGVTLRDIVERNGEIDPRKLFVGTNLRIPTRPLTPPPVIQRPPTPISPTPTPISPTPTPISPTPTLISPTPPPTATPSPSPIVLGGSIIAVTVLGIGVYQFIGNRSRTRDDD